MQKLPRVGETSSSVTIPSQAWREISREGVALFGEDGRRSVLGLGYSLFLTSGVRFLPNRGRERFQIFDDDEAIIRRECRTDHIVVVS